MNGTPEWIKDIMRPKLPPKPTKESSIDTCIMIMEQLLKQKEAFA